MSEIEPEINWPYDEEKLSTLHRILNSLNDSIQLSVETSCEELPFLDVEVKKGGYAANNRHVLETDGFISVPAINFQSPEAC